MATGKKNGLRGEVTLLTADLESPPALASYGLQTTPGGGVVSTRVAKPLDCHLREVRGARPPATAPERAVTFCIQCPQRQNCYIVFESVMSS